jgi:hypothetical protein
VQLDASPHGGIESVLFGGGILDASLFIAHGAFAALPIAFG